MVSNKCNKHQMKDHPLTKPDEICCNDCSSENVFIFYFIYILFILIINAEQNVFTLLKMH